MSPPQPDAPNAAAIVRRRVRSAKPPRRGRRRALVLVLSLLFVVQVLSPASMIILIAGMTPTIVAYFVDPETAKRGTHAMAVLNMAGVLPVVAELWAAGATRTAAMALLSDPMNWLLMYGGAGLAVFMMAALPPFVAQVLEVGAKQQVAELEEQQRKLVEQWGRSVAGAAPEPAEGSASGEKKAAGS